VTIPRAVDPATGWLISPIVATALCDFVAAMLASRDFKEIRRKRLPIFMSGADHATAFALEHARTIYPCGSSCGLAKRSIWPEISPVSKPRQSPDVRERALAYDQSESVAEHEAQTLVGKRMKALQINRQRMNARSKWRRRGDGGRRSFNL
jgi:hypothetical protein